MGTERSIATLRMHAAARSVVAIAGPLNFTRFRNTSTSRIAAALRSHKNGCCGGVFQSTGRRERRAAGRRRTTAAQPSRAATLGEGGAAATNASPLPFGRNNLAWGGGTAWPSIASRMNQHYDSHQPLKPVSVSAARPQSWPWDRQRRSGWPLHGEGCQTPPACP